VQVTTFSELQHAVSTALPGDTIFVEKDLAFMDSIYVYTPVRIQGEAAPHLTAKGRFPLFVCTVPVSLQNLNMTGYNVSPRPILVDYSQAMCAVELRSTAHLLNCSIQSYGTCVLLTNGQEELSPQGVVITGCTFHDSICAGICIKRQKAPTCFRVHGNQFVRNGWGFQDDGNPWGTLEDRFPGWTQRNRFEDNRYKRLPE
jgi:hypothetical protein